MCRMLAAVFCLLMLAGVAHGQQSGDSTKARLNPTVSLMFNPHWLFVENMIDIGVEVRLNDEESLGSDAGYELNLGYNAYTAAIRYTWYLEGNFTNGLQAGCELRWAHYDLLAISHIMYDGTS